MSLQASQILRLEKLDMEWNLKNMVAEEGIKRKQLLGTNSLMRVMKVLDIFCSLQKG
jgi:hypothetical protein